MCAILQLVSALSNPRPIVDHFRRSHPLCELTPNFKSHSEFKKLTPNFKSHSEFKKLTPNLTKKFTKWN